MGCPCETRTSTCRSFATISSGLYRFLAITVLLDVKDIPQVGPFQGGRIPPASNSVRPITGDRRSVRPPPMLHCTVRTARHAAGRHRAFRKRSMRIGGGSSDDLLPPSPPAEKAT